MSGQIQRVDDNLTLDDLRSVIPPIARRHGVIRIRLFGSRSRGDYRDGSDYDFLIAVEKSVSLLDMGCLVYDLEEALEEALGKPVGISFEDASTELFMEAVAPDLIEILL